MTYKEQATQEWKSKSEPRERFGLDAGWRWWERRGSSASPVGPPFPPWTSGDQYKKDKEQPGAEFPFQKQFRHLNLPGLCWKMGTVQLSSAYSSTFSLFPSSCSKFSVAHSTTGSYSPACEQTTMGMEKQNQAWRWWLCYPSSHRTPAGGRQSEGLLHASSRLRSFDSCQFWVILVGPFKPVLRAPAFIKNKSSGYLTA